MKKKTTNGYFKKKVYQRYIIIIYIGDEKNDQLPQFRGGFRPR